MSIRHSSYIPEIIVSSSNLPLDQAFSLNHLEPLNPISSIEDYSLHIDVKCLKCDHQFRVTPKAVSNTFLDPNNYSHCPSCRENIDVVIRHIHLKQAIFEKKQWQVNQEDVSKIVSKNSKVRLTDISTGQEYWFKAGDLAYKQTKLPIKQNSKPNKTSSVPTEAPKPEFNISDFLQMQQHPSVEFRKEYYYSEVTKLNNLKPKPLRGWEDVVVFARGTQIMVFTLGDFSDMDCRYLTDDVEHAFGKGKDVVIFDEQKMLKVLQEQPA